MYDCETFIKGSDSKDDQQTRVMCGSAVSPRASTDPAQCTSPLMTLLLVILLSGEAVLEQAEDTLGEYPDVVVDTLRQTLG